MLERQKKKKDPYQKTQLRQNKISCWRLTEKFVCRVKPAQTAYTDLQHLQNTRLLLGEREQLRQLVKNWSFYNSRQGLHVAINS